MISEEGIRLHQVRPIDVLERWSLIEAFGRTARFRVKKKEREQALAKNAKELQDKVAVLEKEVDLLKKENGWLRGLIVEKAKVRFDVFVCLIKLTFTPAHSRTRAMQR